VRFAIRWMSFVDDPVAPLGAVEALRSYYPKAPVERWHLAPVDLGTAAIGHFGFFRKSMPRGAWDDLASWLGARLRPSQARGQTGRRHESEERPACPHPMSLPRSKTASAG
jgi:hypothetical protein